MREIHILFTPSWYPTCHSPLNGIFFREQAQALHKAGFKVGVVYPDIRSLREVSFSGLRDNHFQTLVQKEDGIQVVRFQGWNLPRFRRGDLLFRLHASRLMLKYIECFGRPDLIHAQGALWGGVVAARALRRFGIPYVITEHSSLYVRNMVRQWQIPSLRDAFSGATEVMAVSLPLSQQIAQYMGGRKARVVPNVVDTNFFTLPATERAQRPFRFLSVAFFSEKKGLDVLLSAFAKAFKGRGDILLEIGGDGPLRDKLERLAAELGISDQVLFLGMLAREEVRAAMWRANTFVLASHVETFGVVLIEAMSTGLPVVATRCGGPEGFVVPDVGILTEAGNDESLADALTKACDSNMQIDPVLLRKYAVDNFGEQKLVERLSLVYDDALNAKTRTNHH